MTATHPSGPSFDDHLVGPSSAIGRRRGLSATLTDADEHARLVLAGEDDVRPRARARGRSRSVASPPQRRPVVDVERDRNTRVRPRDRRPRARVAGRVGESAGVMPVTCSSSAPHDRSGSMSSARGGCRRCPLGSSSTRCDARARRLLTMRPVGAPASTTARASTPSARSSRSTRSPISSAPTRPIQVDAVPSRARPIATLLSAPPIPRRKSATCASDPIAVAAKQPHRLAEGDDRPRSRRCHRSAIAVASRLSRLISSQSLRAQQARATPSSCR